MAFSLQNTSNKPVYWSEGEWETAYGPTPKADRRKFGYRYGTIEPGRKEVYTLWCTIPKGRGHGVMSAWGSGRHYKDANKHRFKWRVTIKCP